MSHLTLFYHVNPHLLLINHVLPHKPLFNPHLPLINHVLPHKPLFTLSLTCSITLTHLYPNLTMFYQVNPYLP